MDPNCRNRSKADQKNKPDKHTHDDLIDVTPDEFFKMAFDAAKRIEGNIND